MSNFMPDLHFVNPSEKLTAEWAKQCVDYFYYNTHNTSLLEGKKIKEIDSYTDGNFSMEPYKRMFLSHSKSNKNRSSERNAFSQEEEFDPTGIDWTPLALIPMKFNAAVATVHNRPVEITCKANDLAAAEKIEEDIKFLKKKPQMEAELQELADQMGIGKVDMGTTKHAETPYSDSPYGLDMTDPDELDVFKNMLYKLGVVAAFETGLTEYWNLKEADDIRELETIDQFKYGVSCHQAFDSAITGLPDISYVYPDNMKVPESKYKDYRDNTHRIMEVQFTPMELFNRFSNSIKDKETLDKILNDEKTGYCACNKRTDIDVHSAEWGKAKIDVVYMEVRSIDWVGVVRKPNNSKNKRDFSYLTTEEKSDDGVKITDKIWGQNTYCFWWLKKTDHFFGIDRLGYAHRTKGMESHQNFSTNIWRSQKKSAAELAIGENKKAQIADIKLQHCLVKSQPPGRSIDIAFIRNAALGLKTQDGQPLYTIEDLVRLLLEENTEIGDSTGPDNTPSNARPATDRPGGIRAEVEGYFTAIRNADYNIEKITGINGQLTGSAANPEALVGMQKLLINQAVNALRYCTRAIDSQYKRLFPIWAYVLKKGIDDGGKVREMIAKLIGAKKVDLIDRLKETSLHDIGVSVQITLREEERAKFQRSLQESKQKGAINSADEYMIDSISNPKEQMAMLAVKEIQFLKRMDRERKENMAHQQQMLQQQGQNAMQVTQAQLDGDIKQIYAKADAETKVIGFAKTLGMTEMQTNAALKRILQRDRLEAQKEKAFGTIDKKANAEQQKAIGG